MSESHAADIDTVTRSGLGWAKCAILDQYNRIVQLADTTEEAERICAIPSPYRWIPVQIRESTHSHRGTMNTAKIHRRVVYSGVIKIPSKALCGAPGKRTSSDDEVTCRACQKLMGKREPTP
jgi:hypothetical protein